jgi:hypothetical protein
MGAEQEQIVLTLLKLAEGQQPDVDGMVALVSDDISYSVGVPATPHVGKDAFRGELENQKRIATGLLPGSEIRHVVSDDRRVSVERLEVFEMGTTRLALHIVGIF